MTIAVHISASKNPAASYLYQLATRFAAQNPEDHVLILYSSKAAPTKLPANCTPVKVSPGIRNSLLLHYWFNYKLPLLLKRYAAEVFLTDAASLSQKTSIPQFLVFDSPVFPLAKDNKFRRYLTRFLPEFCRMAKGIIVPSRFVSENIIATHDFLAGKIHVIPYGINPVFRPVSWSNKEAFIEAFTSGKDYFLFQVNDASRPNLLAVIKAFSQFKKWQKSSIQLVLMTDEVMHNPVPNFDTYKYREEVHTIVPEDDQHRANITGCAYGLIHLPTTYQVKNVAIEAMECDVPVIGAQADFLVRDLENAALFTDPTDHSIAEKMMLLYKDENLRATLLENGRRLAQQHQWT
ncbi:MAG: hypothetical protein EOO20_27855, partial [Chryseobacterium sp.]